MIYNMAENVKGNQERSQELAKKVKLLENLVRNIQQSASAQMSLTLEETLNETLLDLCNNLKDAQAWMEKFSQTKRFMSFVKSGSHERQFQKLDKKLSENIQALTLALQVEQRDVVNKVWNSVRHNEGVQKRPKIPFPGIDTPDPTFPLSSSYSTMNHMPSPGQSQFPLTMNPGLVAGFPACNPLVLPNSSAIQPGFGFSNITVYRPGVMNFSTMAPVSVPTPFSPMTFQTNTPASTTIVLNRSYVLTNMKNTHFPQ